RYYNSRFVVNKRNGVGWTHSYDTRINYQKDIDPQDQTVLNLIQADGREMVFQSAGEPVLDDKGIKVAVRFYSAFTQDGYIEADKVSYTWHWPQGRKLHFDNRGLLTRIEQGQQALTLFRNHDGWLVAVQDPQGRRLTFRYEQGYMHYVRFDEQKTYYRYTRQGQLRFVIRPDKSEREYRYESKVGNHLLTHIVDERGIVAEEFAYGKDGFAIRSAKAGGVEGVDVEYEYLDAVNGKDRRVTRVKSGLGAVTEYIIEQVSPERELVVEVKGHGCTVCAETGVKYRYNERYQITEFENKTGSKWFYDYDDRGRVTTVYQQRPGSEKQLKRRLSYKGNATQPARISWPSIAPGQERSISFNYDKFGRLTSRREEGFAPLTPLNKTLASPQSPVGYVPVSREVKFAYNAQGLLSHIDGPREDAEDITRFSYNDKQLLTEIITPSGRVTRNLAYDNHGRVIKMQQGERTPLTIQYHNTGKPSKFVQGAIEVSYEYDKVGNLVAVLDPDGKRHTMAYDEASRLVNSKQQHGPSLNIDYDIESSVTSQRLSNALNQTWQTLQFSYDAQRRLNQQVHKESGNKSLYQYNEAGQLSSIDDGEQKRLFRYSPLGDWAELEAPDEGISRTYSDQYGNNTGIKDANGNHTRYRYDDLGRVVAIDSPASGLEYIHHDKAGNQIATLNASGQKSTIRYDAANRAIHYQSQTTEISYRYNPSL
ncbi:MAG: hypothetical protein OIF38_09820, partial [Cellvibrionaceae bacterium]|nr:hypothetical protein [Cellvibrionaceae bacterium]